LSALQPQTVAAYDNGAERARLLNQSAQGCGPVTVRDTPAMGDGSKLLLCAAVVLE
jgi:hypothetical protein